MRSVFAGHLSGDVPTNNSRRFCNNGLIQTQPCGGGNVCRGGQCVAPECTAADRSCINRSLARTCVGGEFVNQTCGANQHCEEGSCVVDECIGTARVCLSSTVVQFCSGGALGTVTCGPGRTCRGGECQICVPGETTCEGNLLRTCSEDGQFFQTSTNCGTLGCNPVSLSCGA